MRFWEGTTGQKALFGLIVGVFVLTVGLVLHLESQLVGDPEAGVGSMPSRTPPDLLFPLRADVAEMGLVYGSRWEIVNGVPAADKHGYEGRALLHHEIGAVNVLTIRQPGGARLELKIPVTVWTWGDVWFFYRQGIIIGTLYFLTGVLFFLLRPYDATSWALLCGGSFVGAQVFKFATGYPDADFYNVVSSGLLGVFTVSVYHSALAFPVPHRLLKRVPRATGWLYAGALGPAALWLGVTVAQERGHPDLASALVVAGLGLMLLGSCLFVGRQCVWAVGRRDRTIQQRARLLVVGSAAAFLPIFSVLILQTAFGLLPAVPLSVVQPLVLVFPLVLGYAMVRNDMFDARIAVRRVGAYALAGGAAVTLIWLGGQVSTVLAAALLLPVLYLAPRFNARLNALLHPRRAQFSGLHRVIGDELAASATREAVVEVLAAAPLRVCETDSGAAFLLPGAAGDTELVSGSGETDVSDVHALADEPLVQMLVVSRQVIKRESLGVDPQFALIKDAARACMDRLHAAVLLPIERDGRVIGGLAVGPHVRGDVYDPAELELLRDLAHDAVHALATAELREQSTPGGRPRTPTASAFSPAPGDSLDFSGSASGYVLPAVAGDRYEVRGLLGEGGFKRVYLAHDAMLDRDVALAVIRAHRLDDEGRTRVRREAQAMAQLGDHPHLVTVYDMGETDDELYIVSQYMPGGDLDSKLADAPGLRLPLDEAVRIGRDLCTALAEAHGRGILHRDLKPGNVWLSADGRAALGDFGLALSVDQSRITQSGYLVGTLAYTAPELFHGEPPSVQSDLYALGVLLYEVMAGRRPYEASSTAAMIHEHLRTTPAAPSSHNPDIPAALDALILQLLAKDPADRYPDAPAVHAALAAGAG